MNKTITVFGSAKPTEGDEQYETAYLLGTLLGQNGLNVCTGGFNGIMEAVSKGVKELNREAIGITVKDWGKSPNKFLTKEIKCDTLFDRVKKLIELGDGFIILQGGTGTLLELAAVWELSNKGMMDHKPIACHSSMWQGIVSIMNLQMVKEGRNTELVNVFETIEEIVQYLSSSLNQ
jgi:uncharacterized protein (TIGR00730 family)